jgi:hypothetical protein
MHRVIVLDNLAPEGIDLLKNLTAALVEAALQQTPESRLDLLKLCLESEKLGSVDFDPFNGGAESAGILIALVGRQLGRDGYCD